MRNAANPNRPIPNPLAIRKRGPDNWTLLVNPDTAAAIAVNPTGALIWKLADGRRTAEDIAARIRRRFPQAPETVADDVAELLGTLSAAGLLGQDLTKDQGRRTKDSVRMTKDSLRMTKD